MICPKYHPADEPCLHTPFLLNGQPAVIVANGARIPVMESDVDGGTITLDLSGCCDREKGMAIAGGYQMVIE